jgi:hypothetical protein
VFYVSVGLFGLALIYWRWAHKKDGAKYQIARFDMSEISIDTSMPAKEIHDTPQKRKGSSFPSSLIFLLGCDTLSLFKKKEADFTFGNKGMIYCLRLAGYSLINSLLLTYTEVSFLEIFRLRLAKSTLLGHIAFSAGISEILMTIFVIAAVYVGVKCLPKY